ncbi:MAG: PfkB family carbohydrate kinase [Candidatus Micrarchaeota archaeon]
MKTTIEQIEANGEKIAILVVGDVMIDEYHYCKTERKTPEGPFMVWDLLKVEKRLGGAGNIAHNIRALGANATLAGVAQDGEIDRLADDNGIQVVIERDGRPTTVKRRFVDTETKMLLAREDVESREPVSRETAGFIVKRLKKEFDAVIYSDYNKGMLNKGSLTEFLKIKGKKKIADVKPENVQLFAGKVDLMKMNFKELQKLAAEYGEKIQNEDADVVRAGRKIRDELKADLLLTRSEKGMTFIGEELLHLKAEAKDVIDITGAGDVVMAAFTVAWACGASIQNAALLSNVAASIKVSKRGAVPVSLEEIKAVTDIESRKVLSEAELKKAVDRLRAAGKKIVFTNGCFDVLHHGHIYFLKKAREMGDVLIVGLNSDTSVKKLKGAGRPKIPQHGRAELLAAMPFVDYVVIFDTDTPEYLVELLKPEVYAKGRDYKEEALPEARIVESYGGKIKLIDLVSEEGKKVSSSDIIKG